MFGEVDEHTTQETYLGHNMADAIACFHNGRWPTGLESLEQILGRQGNLVTVDDMFLLMQNNIAVYNTVTSKCYAVRTCMPDPEHEHGGCTRQHRPGCQTFVPNIETGWKAYFRRGAGRHGECGACPIASETGLNSNKDRSSFRGETLKLGVHRFNRITTTDVLHLNYQQPVGGAPTILLGERGHCLKFNKPGALEESTINNMFRALAEDAEPKIDVDDHGTVFVDKPFVSRSSNASDWETVYGVEHEEVEWEISITNFSPTRIRYFVGSVDPSQALHPFVERASPVARCMTNVFASRLRILYSFGCPRPSRMRPILRHGKNDLVRRLWCMLKRCSDTYQNPRRSLTSSSCPDTPACLCSSKTAKMCC